ncbi:MAG: hypothetical protein IPP47_09750 [Bryobacterales bacterium]|nr:hypothetical protein [Bryobacterales bacterium]
MSEFESLPVVQPFARSAAEAAAPRPVIDYSLKVDTGSSLAEAFVIDGSFNMLARGQGKLDLRLPAGEYLVKYRTGDKSAEQWITLDKDMELASSHAPAPNSAWSNQESQFAEQLRGQCNLSIVIRDPNAFPPADDVRIRRTDGTTLALLTDPAATGWTSRTASHLQSMGGNVAPGGYVVVVSTPGLRPYAMPVWVTPDCPTQIFLERRTLGTGGKDRRGPHLASASIWIATRDLDPPKVRQLMEMTDAAKSVLSYDRPIVPEEHEIFEALDAKYMCPILGLLAAHLLRLKAKGPNASKTKTLLATVVQNLAYLMPGSPDVGALQLAIGVPPNADFTVPPMLSHSWAILVDPAISVIPPNSYADRIRTAVCATRPWLIWNKSKMTKEAAPAKRGKRTITVDLPPELRQAASQLGKHLTLSLSPEGRVILSRKP